MALERISTIPQIYRNVARWREILGVLSKYGLADWLSRLNVDLGKGLLKTAGGERLVEETHEARMRLVLTELGPTGIKLGQVLSTRPDVVGVQLATELEKLQADTPATPFDAVRKIIEEELGRPPEECYTEFSETPIASASIGQVHAARLADGSEVVVKVQHPTVRRRIQVDLEILRGLAHLADGLPELASYQPSAMVAELERTLYRELDYRRELSNLAEFLERFEDDSTVRIPRSFDELSTARVLTLERFDGIPLAEVERLEEEGYYLEEIARRGARLYLEMIFFHGVYHADPHPGNILVMPGNVIGLIDFGMVGRLDETLQEEVESMLLALAEGDGRLLTSILARLGRAPKGLDRAAFGLDVTDFVSRYSRLPLSRFDLTGALREITELVRTYRIVLPPRIAMLIKTLIVLEGSARRLAPRFNLLELIREFKRRLLARRLSPRRQLRQLRRLEGELRHLLEVLPRGLVDIVEQLQTGRFEIHLDHRGLEPSVNRLVFGLLSSALFLGSALILALGVPPKVFDLSLIGSVGCLVSVALGLRLLRAIYRSGHLDRDPDSED